MPRRNRVTQTESAWRACNILERQLRWEWAKRQGHHEPNQRRNKWTRQSRTADTETR